MFNENFSSLRIGVWEHWFQPEYKIASFLTERFGVEVTPVDYNSPGHLDDIDVLIIEQNGVNDYIENDRDRLHDFVKRGGVCWIMHQDFRRFTPCMLPEELGRPVLVHRYAPTLPALGAAPVRWSYAAPWIEPAGRKLFVAPNRITPDEFLYWRVAGESFGVLTPPGKPEMFDSCAVSCLTGMEKWEVVGSYMDAAVSDGALIAQARYGKGLFFWNQLLFPEKRPEPGDRCIAFWNRFCENMLFYFQAFRNRKPMRDPAMQSPKKKECHKTAIHLHSLDWFAADASFGVISAALRYHKFDVGVIGFKDALAYGDRPDFRKYSDDQVTLLPGLEFHPFNFEREDSHNAYHLLSMGDESCDSSFTRSLFSDTEVKEYLESAFKHIRHAGACSCATHPKDDYWKDYPVDAVDVDWAAPFSGSDLEKQLLAGKRIALMTSVDMWGIQRLRDNPVFNFIYMPSPVTRGGLVSAVRAHHTMAAYGFDSADVRIGQYLPGDALSDKALRAAKAVQVVLESSFPISEISLFAGAQCVFRETLPAGTASLGRKISIPAMENAPFLRFEAKGAQCELRATPFFLEK